MSSEYVNKQLDMLTAKQSVLKDDIVRLEDENKSLTNDIVILEQVNTFFSSQVEQKISSIKSKIETLVNSGLEHIFGDDIKLEITSSIKYSKTTFSLRINNNGVIGLGKTHGGGVLSVVAFILKVVITLLTDKRKFLIFDESLSMVSVHYQPKVSSFIRQLCDDLGFTILLISHQPILGEKAKHIYQVGKKGSYTSLKEIRND